MSYVIKFLDFSFFFKIEILNPKTLMYIGCSKNIPVNWSFVD